MIYMTDEERINMSQQLSELIMILADVGDEITFKYHPEHIPEIDKYNFMQIRDIGDVANRVYVREKLEKAQLKLNEMRKIYEIC